MTLYKLIIAPLSFTFYTSVPPSPEDVIVARLDSTTVSVSWTKLTLVELKGLAMYVITYSLVAVPSERRQLSTSGVRNASWTENRVFISDLQPGAEYDVAVRIFNLAGASGIDLTCMNIYC